VSVAAPQCSCDAPFKLGDYCDVHGTSHTRNELERLRAALAREREAREKAEAELAEHVRWAESNGEPEEWVKRAQAAHGRAEDLAEALDRERSARAQLEAAVGVALVALDTHRVPELETARGMLAAALRASRGDEKE
jgi:hypothetical protein